MRIFALSDIHVDYPENLAWLYTLSDSDYQDDILILAGDVSDSLTLLREALQILLGKFHRLCFVPGNHELWLTESAHTCSLAKWQAVRNLCRELGVQIDVYRHRGISLVPLHGWYDYSFARPMRHLSWGWKDYRACNWPDELDSSAAVNQFFLSLNTGLLQETNDVVISYSHFVPRIELMPEGIPRRKRIIYPVLGSTGLGEQVRELGPAVHVYGHSHVNVAKILDDTLFINNAFGYPAETRIANKQLRCIYPVT